MELAMWLSHPPREGDTAAGLQFPQHKPHIDSISNLTLRAFPRTNPDSSISTAQNNTSRATPR